MALYVAKFVFLFLYVLQAQILDVVRANYDSLTLKLQDSLDLIESYAENPTFTSFFTNLIRSMVTDYRQVYT